MSDHRLHTRFTLDLPLDEVFRFFADAANLARITPPELGFEILSPLPIDMRVGTRIDYRIRLHGIPMRWQSEITRWEPGVCFVDEQLRGPYAKWIHTHHFRADGEGTHLEDEVVYALPLAPLGDIAHPIVRRQLDRIFAYREEVTRHLLAPKGAKREESVGGTT